MLVSVIITTKNEEKNIGNCLDSIIRQTYPCPEMEIIVVDNNSTDKTKEIAEDYRNKILKTGFAPLNISIFNGGPERSAQRNFGGKQAQGKYIIYLDADMTLSPEVIAECVAALEENNQTVALYIPEIIQGDNFWNKVRRLERSFYDGTVIDAARFLRRDIFLKVGGFDEALTGPEDWDLDKKIKKIGKISLIKNPLYHNEGRFSLKNYLKKKAYYSQDFAKYISKWGERDQDIRKQFGFTYRYLSVFWENGKWRKLWQHPFLTAGMYGLRILVGIKYLIKK